MKSFVFTLLVLACARLAVAQQDPLYAQYLNTPMVINPAYAGFTKDVNLAITFRKQWAGFDGSPETLHASGHTALRQNKMGAGLIVLRDKVGTNSVNEVGVTYAYHLPLSSLTTLSFGLQLGAINYRTDYSELTVNPNDPKLVATNQWQANFGAGVILTNDKYFVSVSTPKMLDAATDMARQGLYNRNIYVLGSYALQFTSRLRLKPYAMFRATTKSKSSYDIGANLLGDDSYQVGLFTRGFHTYGIQAQLKLDELLRVGYVFELPTNKSAGAQFTSHEIQVIVRFMVAKFHDLGAVRNF